MASAMCYVKPIEGPICHAFNNSRFNFEQKEATVVAFLISDKVKVSRTPASETSTLYEHLLSVMSGRWVK